MNGPGSNFDESAFLDLQVEGANSTRYTPVPEDEYNALVKDVAFRNQKGSSILDITWVIDSAKAKEATGLPEPTVRQSIFLDFTEGGALDMGKGKNVQLGQLREALNQNDPTRPWSPRMLKGQVAIIKVTHTPDKEDPSKIYANVKGVRKLG